MKIFEQLDKYQFEVKMQIRQEKHFGAPLVATVNQGEIIEVSRIEESMGIVWGRVKNGWAALGATNKQGKTQAFAKKLSDSEEATNTQNIQPQKSIQKPKVKETKTSAGFEEKFPKKVTASKNILSQFALQISLSQYLSCSILHQVVCVAYAKESWVIHMTC